jgi:hypothetical protein
VDGVALVGIVGLALDYVFPELVALDSLMNDLDPESQS